jgi:transcriptional regulator with XRE-family HTH domain
MESFFYKNLGKNIKKYRKKANLTQQELANKLNISLNFMRKIEVAFSKPSLDMLIKIANGLDVSVSDLRKCDA